MYRPLPEGGLQVPLPVKGGVKRYSLGSGGSTPLGKLALRLYAGASGVELALHSLRMNASSFWESQLRCSEEPWVPPALEGLGDCCVRWGVGGGPSGADAVRAGAL